MILFQKKLGRKTSMSSVINQDISIGSNLKALRLRNKLSQEAVAARLQVMGFTMSREIISQIELGRHNIRVSVLLALKELYHATFDEIFADLSFRINESGIE
jgi:transcriptional regulator with XRE-family HTH domain